MIKQGPHHPPGQCPAVLELCLANAVLDAGADELELIKEVLDMVALHLRLQAPQVRLTRPIKGTWMRINHLTTNLLTSAGLLHISTRLCGHRWS